MPYMKYYKVLGLIACVVIVVSCFLPWTFYPDLNKSFNGFFTEENIYGKPGKVFIFFAVLSGAMILLNKIWAKRFILFLAAINVAYFIKTYILFTTCYSALCPVKQYGLYLLMAGSAFLMIIALFPDMKLAEKNEVEKMD